tara:strand:+ start:86 stop:793 length:708 start_codon:yes stop_codon:yes gene_type:complete
MHLYFDIGGTNFRYYILDEYHKQHGMFIQIREQNIFDQLFSTLQKIFLEIDFIISITVSIAGAVQNNSIYGVNNISIEDGTHLMTTFTGIPIRYVNDGDAYLLGELYLKKNIVESYSNVLAIIFGTGVGCGLYINNTLVSNAEIYQYMEKYMKNNVLTEDNIDKVTDFISKQLRKFIIFLNLHAVIIGGYVNKYDNFEYLIKQKINLPEMYNTDIIISKSTDSILRGLVQYRLYY